MARLVAFLLMLLLSSACLAQTELEGYLSSTDPILTRIVELNEEFLDTIGPLRKSKDLLALQGAVTRWDADWNELKVKLTEIVAPASATAYHASLGRMVEVQSASNALFLKSLNDGLALTAEIKAMKANGTTPEAMEARITEFKADKEAVAKEVEAYRAEALRLDETLKNERQALGELKA